MFVKDLNFQSETSVLLFLSHSELKMLYISGLLSNWTLQ